MQNIGTKALAGSGTINTHIIIVGAGGGSEEEEAQGTKECIEEGDESERYVHGLQQSPRMVERKEGSKGGSDMAQGGTTVRFYIIIMIIGSRHMVVVVVEQ